MTNVVIKEPKTDIKANQKTSITVRNMTRSESDCRFMANLKVDSMSGKYIHATSKGSLPSIKRMMSRNHEEQDDWYFQRNFIAEYDKEPVGNLTLQFADDPEPLESDYEQEFGCTDQCGLNCLSRGLDETIQADQMYLKHIYVLGEYRNKGVGEELLNVAEREAKRKHISTVFLYVAFRNRAKQLYLRQGYRSESRTWCCVWCAMGSCGFHRMEKQLI